MYINIIILQLRSPWWLTGRKTPSYLLTTSILNRLGSTITCHCVHNFVWFTVITLKTNSVSSYQCPMTCVGTYLYSVRCTHHGNLLVTTSWWPISFRGPTRARTNTVKKQGENSGEGGGGGGGVNRPERQILEQKTKTFLAVREACVATFWPTRGFEGRTFVSSGFSTEGYFNLCVRSAPLRSRERPRGREWGGGGSSTFALAVG